MTARENMLALLKKGNPERIGLHDNLWTELMRQWRTQGHMIRNDPENGGKVEVSAEEWFDYDLIFTGGWIDCFPELGCEEIIDETDEWKLVKNGAGAVFRWWKNKSGTPEHVSFDMTSREIWEEKYRHLLLDTDDARLNISGAAALAERWKNEDKAATIHEQFLFEIFRKCAGDMAMFESLAIDKEWVDDFNRVYTDFIISHYKRLLEVCGKPDVAYIYEDLGYKNGLFCSPETLRELYLPYYKQLVTFFHMRDIPVIVHSCGNIEKAIPIFIEAGFDALNPMEVKAGCDALRFAEMYGDKLAFVGGVDTRVFESGDRSLIKKEVKRMMQGMKDRNARYVFGSDHSITSAVKYEDYLYALEVYKDNMMY